ncbi:MAG: serine hydrolase [Gemmatimonadota bacterium]
MSRSPSRAWALSSFSVALVAFTPGAPVSAQAAGASDAPFPSDSAIISILRERVEQGRSAGIVIGLLEPDGATRVLAWGDPGPGQPPLDGESVFEIGSITKVFTGSVLADMALKGEVSLDDPVRRYLPPGMTVPMWNGTEITLRTLAEQNSGLPRMPDNFAPADPSNPYVDYDVERLYEFLSGYELPRSPGETFEYSNLGVGLLGHVLALHAGTSYAEVVRDRILEPLVMTHTGVALTPWMREHLALGHGSGGGVVPNWDLGALAGAGALRSTAVDMLRFLDAALHPERGSIQRALAFAQEERADAGGMRIGLNWISMHADSDTIVWHNGGTAGYRTFIGIVPSRRIGVVVLTNSGGAGADDIGRHLLHPEFPLASPPSPWTGRLRILVVAVLATLLVAGAYKLHRRRGARHGTPQPVHRRRAGTAVRPGGGVEADRPAVTITRSHKTLR